MFIISNHTVWKRVKQRVCQWRVGQKSPDFRRTSLTEDPERCTQSTRHHKVNIGQSPSHQAPGKWSTFVSDTKKNKTTKCLRMHFLYFLVLVEPLALHDARWFRKKTKKENTLSTRGCRFFGTLSMRERPYTHAPHTCTRIHVHKWRVMWEAITKCTCHVI